MRWKVVFFVVSLMVLLCFPVYAVEKMDRENVSRQFTPTRFYPDRGVKVSASTTTVLTPNDRILAGPLKYTKDFCDLYGVPVYAIDDYFWGLEWYANYQDPEEFGCVDVWPFEVIEVGFNILVDYAIDIDVQGFIFDADFSVPDCPVPGAQLSQTPIYTVSIPDAGHWIIGLSMTEQCCVYDPYFAGIYIYTDLYGSGADAISEDDPSDICRSYNDYGEGWHDLVVFNGWPGEMLLWSTGYTSPQNSCPMIETGACCNEYDCQELTPTQCAGLPDHTFMGPGTQCDPANPCIPPPCGCYTIANPRPEWFAVNKPFIRGDANNDGVSHVGDVVFLLNYLYRACPPPECMDAGDVNDDGNVGPGDVVYLLNYLYRGGYPPPAPCCDLYEDCDQDPTDDGLDCKVHVCEGGPVLAQAQPATVWAKDKVALGKGEIIDHKLIVPVYLTTPQPLSAFSYNIAYDPAKLTGISVDGSGLITEDFEFFSGWFDEEDRQIKVGGVVDFEMIETLPAGTHEVARLIFYSPSFAAVFPAEVSLEVAEAIFIESEIRPKKRPDQLQVDVPVKMGPSYSKATTEIVYPPDGTGFQVYELQTLQFDVKAKSTTPGGSVCVFTANLPSGVSFCARCDLDSVVSTFSWPPADSQTGTYPVTVYAAPDLEYPHAEDSSEINILVSECENLGDTSITDLKLDFTDRGYRHYQDPDMCPNGCPWGVNPISGGIRGMGTDVVFTQETQEDDPPLEIALTYNSGSFFNGRYGYGWQLNYNVRYVTNCLNDNVIVVREDDRTDIFVKQTDGSFKPTYGVRDSLAKLDSDGYVLVTKHGIKYWFESSDHHYMTRLEDRNHNELIFDYNQDKQLTTVTDPCGRQLDFEYQDNKLIRITGPEDREVSFGYDGDGDLRWICNPLGDTTHYEYYTSETGCHDLKSITDARGNTRTFTYNSDYQIETITTCCGTRTFSYDRENRRTTETDENGHSTIYSYDEKGRIVQIEDAMGSITQWAWDDDYNKTGETDANGNTTYWTYDSKGNVLTEVNALGDTTCYTWELVFNRMTSRTDANHHTTTYEYDSLGNLISYRTPLGDSSTYTYDSRGLMLTETNSRGYTTNFEYNDCRDRIRTIDALACTTSYIHDAVGNDTLMIDANGNSTRYVYDDLNRVIHTVDALDCTTSYFYDAVGNDTLVIDANGNPTKYEYDELNRLVRAIDALDCTTSYFYDAVGNDTLLTDAHGNPTKYEYDELNRRVRSIDALDCTTSYFYDAVGNDTLVTDANGNPAKYDYDELSRLVRAIDALDCTTSYFYDAVGSDTQVTDANGNSTGYEYDELNRRIKMIDALGGETDYTYDPVGNRISRTNCKGDSTRYEYDPLNRLIRTIDAVDCTTSFAYDAVGNRIARTNGNGHTTSYEYDERNRLTRTIDALACTTAYEYDPVGNRISLTDGNGRMRFYRYDELNRLWRTVRDMEAQADSAVTDYEYDKVGNVIASIDPNGNRTEYEYDERDELVRRTNPEGESTLYEYDCVENLTKLTSRNGNVNTYEYDAKSQLINVSDSVGQVGSYTYDCVGNRLTVTDANNHTTMYEYDALNRRVCIIDPMGESKTYSYDCVGNLDTLIDRNGNPRVYTYDAANRRTSRTDALGNLTTYEYDCVDNRIRITDANGNATAYEYDAVNRLIREIYADTTTREFAYDCVGNVLTRTDQLGNITTYEYDDLYHMTGRDYPDANDDQFTHDKGGRRITAQNVHSFITFDYDSADRVIETSQNGDTVRYTYDVASGQRTIFYPGGKVITETRDKRNRLVDVVETTVSDTIARYVYDAADRLLSKIYLNGTAANYSYNDNDWVDSLTHTKGATLIAGFAYDFDKERNRKYAENLLPFDPTKRHTHSEKYDYDAVYRLVDFKTGQLIGGDIPSPIKTRTWTLDPVGNWDQFSIDGVDYNNTPNQMNEYDDPSTNGPPPVPDDDGIPDDFKDPLPNPPYDGYNSAHDKNGNLLDDDVNTYEYDYENRLIRVIRKFDGDTLGEYRYDPLSRRIEKDTAGLTIVYLYDSRCVIEERIGGLVEAEYVYGDWIDEVLTMDRGGQTYCYHTNSLGGIIALTDELGNGVERYSYDAYGQAIIADGVGNVLPNSAVGNPYLFTGHRLDQESGLYYYRARHYSPVRGRFLQRDPQGYTDGMNLYEYVRGNPGNRLDPLGLEAEERPTEGNWEVVIALQGEDVGEEREGSHHPEPQPIPAKWSCKINYKCNKNGKLIADPRIKPRQPTTIEAVGNQSITLEPPSIQLERESEWGEAQGSREIITVDATAVVSMGDPAVTIGTIKIKGEWRIECRKHPKTEDWVLVMTDINPKKGTRSEGPAELLELTYEAPEVENGYRLTRGSMVYPRTHPYPDENNRNPPWPLENRPPRKFDGLELLEPEESGEAGGEENGEAGGNDEPGEAEGNDEPSDEPRNR